jgi:lysophospholipase L1-like esterase
MPSPRLAREILFRVVAVAIGVVAALALSEGLIRLAAPKKLKTVEAEEFAQFDPWLGWANRPGASGLMRIVGQDDILARINSRGLRDREIGPTGRKTGRRILCLGDSFTWGWGVGDDETYPKILEHELAGVETVNAGVCAWGTAQELVWLEREGFRYDPDAVTVGFYLNDFADNASDSAGGYRRPVYALEGGRLVLKGVPIPMPRNGALETVNAFVQRHLLTLRLLAAAWQWIDRGFLRTADLTPIERARLRGPGPHRPPAEAETGAILNEARRVCEAKGVRFLVLAIPSMCQVRPSAPLACREQDDVTYAALIHLCAAAGIDVVEPLDELRAAEKGGLPVFPQSDFHWNAAGHRIAARLLARRLAEAPRGISMKLERDILAVRGKGEFGEKLRMAPDPGRLDVR